ncbi:MAG: MBL fold metallo-hydrolase [Bacillota bacterium]
MQIHRLVVGPIETNCYILADEEKNAIIVDPGDEADVIQDFLKRGGIKIKEILLTHTHYDHIGAVNALMESGNATLKVAAEEGDWLSNPGKNLSLILGGTSGIANSADMLKDGDTVGFGSLAMKVIHTPGHTPGGLCFYHPEGHLFSGDTLFKDGIGRTDFPGGNYLQLVDSIRNKLFILPGDTKVYPGHGPFTDIAAEMQGNRF